MLGIFALMSDCDSVNVPRFEAFRNSEVICSEIKEAHFYCKRVTLNKFINDKVFVRRNDIILYFDGVILNKTEIVKKYNTDFENLLFNMYSNGSLKCFISELRGNFECVIIDLASKKITAFVDQLGNRILFYYISNKTVIISSELRLIAQYLRAANLECKLDKGGAYSLLTYAYMYENHTFLQDVKRLKEGEILFYSPTSFKIEKYYQICFEPQAISQNEAIEKIDYLFRKAVKLQYEKNLEYGYDNYVPLSAGLDCRMTSLILRDIAKKPITNFTYSETGELDEKLPMAMARFLNNRWLFKSLDGGHDLANIEEAVYLADSLIYYGWPAQLNDFMKMVNTQNWGIVHTGVLGDTIIGSSYKGSNSNQRYVLGAGAYSTMLIKKLEQNVSFKDAEYEAGMFTNRGFNGICPGYNLTFRQYTEAMSPFMYLELFEFCMRLPAELRCNHKIYYNWLLKKYPSITQFAHNGIKIAPDRCIRLMGKSYRVGAIVSIIKTKLYKLLHKNNGANFIMPIIAHFKHLSYANCGMNPQDYWYKTNNMLRKCMNDYISNYGKLLKNEYPELYNDTIKLYNTGTTIEKILAISFVGSMRLMGFI